MDINAALILTEALKKVLPVAFLCTSKKTVCTDNISKNRLPTSIVLQQKPGYNIRE